VRWINQQVHPSTVKELLRHLTEILPSTLDSIELALRQLRFPAIHRRPWAESQVCLLSSPQLGFFLHLLLRKGRVPREKQKMGAVYWKAAPLGVCLS
jgi:hypothetical protein